MNAKRFGEQPVDQELNKKRIRGWKRLSQHGQRLEASVEETSVLELRSMGGSEPDYRRMVKLLWDLMAHLQLAMQPPDKFDHAVTECFDFRYLGGESSLHSTKLKAALAALHPKPRPPGPLVLVLSSWRRAAPTCSRSGTQKGATFCGVLFRRHLLAMALCSAGLLSTCCRPSALATLWTDKWNS